MSAGSIVPFHGSEIRMRACVLTVVMGVTAEYHDRRRQRSGIAMARALLLFVLAALSFVACADNPNAPLVPLAPNAPTGPPAPAAPQPPESDLTSHVHYVNHAGNIVHSPSTTVSGAVPAGASAQCRDGTYSFSRNRRGTCSYHGGVARWL